jgi:type I restriction enzyme R subunit
MDFRGVTRHFADPDFDGEPVKVYEPKEGESIKNKIEEETETKEEILEKDPAEEILITEEEQPKEKIVVSEGVEFNVASRMIQYIDPKTGKLIAESLETYSKKLILQNYKSVEEFLNAWNETERKEVIIEELLEHGIVLEELRKEVGLNIDDFDLILHVAYNKKPLTRSERSKNVSKQDYFAKYEGRARAVLEALLEKYAEEGSEAIDDIGDLAVPPLTDFGTPIEIVEEIFGGKEKYMKAVRGMQSILYATN